MTQRKLFFCELEYMEKRNLLLKDRVGSRNPNPLDRRFLMNQVDRIRLEEFRQIRKEIRGSAEYLIVGIDVAKDRHVAFFGTAMGKTLFRRLFFDNNLA